MPTLEDYARHSPYSDPGPYAALLEPLPVDVRELAAVVRNVVVHYRAAGITFTGGRLAEIDNRWAERLLATDQDRFDAPLEVPRAEPERVAGCCRDFTLLTVAALRHRGVPARSRVGFTTYFSAAEFGELASRTDQQGGELASRTDQQGGERASQTGQQGGETEGRAGLFHNDHVIAEYWNGERWVFVDAELEPGPKWPFDPTDIPYLVGANPPSTPLFETAAQTWVSSRTGRIDAQQYGVDPELPYRGGWFVRNYVVLELAHRQRDELLLWDGWGAMSGDLDGDLGLIDEVAALLLAADDGDGGAEQELADRYANDPRLNPGRRVRCLSPSGTDTWVDLETRERVDTT